MKRTYKKKAAQGAAAVAAIQCVRLYLMTAGLWYVVFRSTLKSYLTRKFADFQVFFSRMIRYAFSRLISSCIHVLPNCNFFNEGLLPPGQLKVDVNFCVNFWELLVISWEWGPVGTATTQKIINWCFFVFPRKYIFLVVFWHK